MGGHGRRDESGSDVGAGRIAADDVWNPKNPGLPWLADLPWFGVPFRRVEEVVNEVELLILVTPEFVEAVDPEEVPPCGPGESTTTPNDVELYFRGYMEVPKCCEDGSCPKCQHGGAGESIVPGDIQPQQAVPHEAVPRRSIVQTARVSGATRRDEIGRQDDQAGTLLRRGGAAGTARP